MKHPGIVAASIAGGTIGLGVGFMTKGEELENQGAGEFKQFFGSIGGGIYDGAIGAGIGAGVGGTAWALRKVLTGK